MMEEKQMEKEEEVPEVDLIIGREGRAMMTAEHLSSPPRVNKLALQCSQPNDGLPCASLLTGSGRVGDERVSACDGRLSPLIKVALMRNGRFVCYSRALIC